MGFMEGLQKMERVRLTVQVLNGATGEVREVSANVKATDEQDATNKVFAHARKDDYYYRFLGMHGVIAPTGASATPVKWQEQTYWALE